MRVDIPLARAPPNFDLFLLTTAPNADSRPAQDPHLPPRPMRSILVPPSLLAHATLKQAAITVEEDLWSRIILGRVHFRTSPSQTCGFKRP